MPKVLKIFLAIILVIFVSFLVSLYFKKPQKPEIVELKKESSETSSPLFKRYTIEFIKPPTTSKPLLTYEEKPTNTQEATIATTTFSEAEEISFSEVVITAKEFEFVPNEIRIKSGDPVLIILKNEGKIPFDLKIVGDNWSVKTELTPPGGESKLEIKFPEPGEYEFFSTIPIAVEKNMKGKIIVEP